MRRVLRLAVILSAAALSPFRGLKGSLGKRDRSSFISPKAAAPAAAPPKTRGLFGRQGARAARPPRRAELDASTVLRAAAEATPPPSADEQLALRATLAALRHELDALRVAYRDLEGAHAVTRRELARARANVTALAADAAKAERLKRRMQIEVHQLRDVAQTATTKALRADADAKRLASRRPATRPAPAPAPAPLEEAPGALTPEARAARIRERTLAAAMEAPEPPGAPTPLERAARLRERTLAAAAELPEQLSQEERAARLRERSLRSREAKARALGGRAPRRPAAITGSFQRGMTAEEVRTPAPILESLHAAPRAAARRAAPAPPAPRPSTIVQRRPIRPGGARPFDSLPTKLARGSTLYQQLQMEAARGRGLARAEPAEARRARPGLLLPFESDVWGFTPDPPKAPPRRPAPRTATILARMGGASEVYREAQLRHVAARKAAPRAARNEPDAADAYDPRGIDV